MCWSLLSIKSQALNFIWKKLQQRCFPAIIAKFLRATILKNICERLLLKRYERGFHLSLVYSNTSSKRRKRTEKNKCLSQIFLKQPKMIYSKRTIHTLNLLRSFLFPMVVSIRKPLALTTETVSRRCSVKRVKRRFQRFCRTHGKIPAAESLF